MTQVYTRWHRFTHAHTGLHTLTLGYTRSHRITHAHTGLHTLTQDYTRWHWITHAHTGLHALTQNYTRWHRIERQADTLVWQRERSANENDFTACWHSRYVTSAAWWTPLPIAPLRMRQCCRSITNRPKPVFPNLFHPRTISRFYAVLAYHLHKLRALKAVKKFPHLSWRHNQVFDLCEVQ